MCVFFPKKKKSIRAPSWTQCLNIDVVELDQKSKNESTSNNRWYLVRGQSTKKQFRGKKSPNQDR
jgi:hypothetical protein